MAKIKGVLSKIRNKLRRAISAQSTDSEQPHSVQDAKDEDNMVQLGSNFIEDIHNK
jgi:C4-type Zn-finger protein